MFIILCYTLAPKNTNGIIKVVNKTKHKEIPSIPKDKFKLYSGIIGNWHTNWKPVWIYQNNIKVLLT